MATIHQVQVFDEKHYEIDPQRGAVLKHSEVLKRGVAQSISHGDDVYEVGEDGTFNVPDDVAEFLCKTPGWFEGPNPFAEEIAAQAENKTDTKPRAKRAKR